MFSARHLRWFLLVVAGTSLFVAVSFILLKPSDGRSSVLLDGVAANHTRLHISIFDSTSRKKVPGLVRLRTADGRYLTFGNTADLPGWGQGGSAIELGGRGHGLLAFRHGFAVWQGEAMIVVGRAWKHRDIVGQGQLQAEVPPGQYQIEVTRGMEYDQVSQPIDLSRDQGLLELDVYLERTVNTRGYVAADLHVHNGPESPDAHLDAAGQLKIGAVGGLDVLVTANHEVVSDLSDVARRLWGHEPPLLPVAGVEHEASNAHFGVFPLEPSDGPLLAKTRPWPLDALFADLKGLPGAPLLVAYHPRLGWKAYLDAPYCGPWAQHDLEGPPHCPQSYDAIEVLSGWQGCGSRLRDATDSWLALLSHNHLVAPVGDSDSHFASAMLAGYPRTFVRVSPDRPGKIRVRQLVEAIRARRTIATTAPFVTLHVGDAREGDVLSDARPKLSVKLRVQAANWVPVETLRLLVNGQVVKSWTLSPKGKAIDFEVDEELAFSSHDVFVTAEAEGRTPLPPSIVGEYSALPEYGLPRCPPSAGEQPGMLPFAVSSAIFVDRDGDGMFRGFRAAAPIAL